MDVPIYAIESAYEKDNIEVASGSNWLLADTRETTPLAVVPEPAAPLPPPERVLIVQDLPDSDAKRPASTVVHFDTDRYTLKPGEKAKLDALPVGAYKVYGYADPRGTQKYNYRLSVSRAKAVAKYLKADGSEVIELMGFGEKRKISNNRDEYDLDRRVEVKPQSK